MTSDRIDLIDEDDTGRFFLGIEEEVSDPGGADTDEHLHKVRAADGKEGNPGLAGHGPGQKGLTCAGRAHQKNPLGDLGAQVHIFFGALEKIHDFLELVLFLLCPGHILEGDLDLMGVGQGGPALAKGHGRLAIPVPSGIGDKDKGTQRDQHEHHDDPIEDAAHIRGPGIVIGLDQFLVLGLPEDLQIGVNGFGRDILFDIGCLPGLDGRLRHLEVEGGSIDGDGFHPAIADHLLHFKKRRILGPV